MAGPNVSHQPSDPTTCCPNRDFETFWPVEWLKAQHAYGYQQRIEEYLSGSRVLVAGRGEMTLLGGYSYLGLNRHPEIEAAALDAVRRFGTGTHGVRLLSGSLSVHSDLESELAAFKRTEAAVTFSSGYMANVSTLAAVVTRHDTVISDKLNHASIVDGCQMSGARFARFRHNDMDDLQRCLSQSTGRRILVVVDGVYSMDGDIADLPGLRSLCDRYGALLMVDEAHSLGVLGATGRGIEEHFHMPPESVDIKMGTLSKAIPSVGGYVACSARLANFLQHQARGFIYSAAIPAPSAAAAVTALRLIRREPQHVGRLHDNTAYFRGRLSTAGFDYRHSQTAVFPIMCGDDTAAWKMAEACQRRGVYIQAIPHPVVPKGTARLRAAVTASHTREELDFCIEILIASARDAGIG